MRVDEFPWGKGISVFELRDANAECRLHGRCAFDRTPPCGCFPLERERSVHPLYHDREVRVRAIQLYAEGRTSRETAKAVGASQRQVLEWARAAGVPVRRRGRPWPDRQKAA